MVNRPRVVTADVMSDNVSDLKAPAKTDTDELDSVVKVSVPKPHSPGF